MTYQNRTLTGIGYQGRNANSPRGQWIVPDPETASVHSDNIDALLGLFENQDASGREKIVESLLHRIALGSEYTPIGYFFLFALFKMGKLPVALASIKDRLRDDEKYGFDNAVMMLSGLLQYDYPAFDNILLDEVERFLLDLDGFNHHLKERCVSARVALPLA